MIIIYYFGVLNSLKKMYDNDLNMHEQIICVWIVLVHHIKQPNIFLRINVGHVQKNITRDYIWTPVYTLNILQIILQIRLILLNLHPHLIKLLDKV